MPEGASRRLGREDPGKGGCPMSSLSPYETMDVDFGEDGRGAVWAASKPCSYIFGRILRRSFLESNESEIAIRFARKREAERRRAAQANACTRCHSGTLMRFAEETALPYKGSSLSSQTGQTFIVKITRSARDPAQTSRPRREFGLWRIVTWLLESRCGQREANSQKRRIKGKIICSLSQRQFLRLHQLWQVRRLVPLEILRVYNRLSIPSRKRFRTNISGHWRVEKAKSSPKNQVPWAEWRQPAGDAFGETVLSE